MKHCYEALCEGTHYEKHIRGVAIPSKALRELGNEKLKLGNYCEITDRAQNSIKHLKG